MTLNAVLETAPPRRPFASQYPLDRNFFLTLLALVWIGIVAGFGLDIADHIRNPTHAYAPIVHVHAALFVGWLVLFTTQLLLIRNRRADIHRRLGLVAVGLIPAMVAAGLATAWAAERDAVAQLGPLAHPQFLSINLTDMLGFATLAGAGIWLRRDSPAHKRLLLLSTLYLSTAGFARWWLLTMGTAGAHSSFGGFFWAYNGGGDVLIVMLGVYDLVTRGRLHPAYVIGTGWILANELAAAWLYFSPAWKVLSLRMLGLA